MQAVGWQRSRVSLSSVLFLAVDTVSESDP